MGPGPPAVGQPLWGHTVPPRDSKQSGEINPLIPILQMGKLKSPKLAQGPPARATSEGVESSFDHPPVRLSASWENASGLG